MDKNKLQKHEDCFSCKLISITCLMGIGCYMFKLGLANKPKFVYGIIGSASIGLGVGEIFDWSPFR